MEAADDLKRDGINLLETFLSHGPFSSECTAEEAMAYLNNMRTQLKALRDKEAQLRDDLRLFDLSLFESPEMARLEKVQNIFINYKPIISIYYKFI